MAIKIKFDVSHTPENPTLILCTRNGTMMGKLNAKHINIKDSMVNAAEVSFDIYKYVDGELDPLWDNIRNFKIVYCLELDTCFEIYLDVEESNETIKRCSGTQLAQSELAQILLHDIEINTETDISRDDYVRPTVLYNANDSSISLLDRIMEKAQHYTITHVDDSIKNIQRTFSFDNKSLFDAFKEISEEIGCVFIYNSGMLNGTIRREIAVYDLQTYCLDCGYRGEYSDNCPKCNSSNLVEGYGNDTQIFITADELAEEIRLTTNTDSVKNCFRLEGGDDLMTATIRSCNPTGTDYLWYFNEDILDDMSNTLKTRILNYSALYKETIDNYTGNVSDTIRSEFNTIINHYTTYNQDLVPLSSTIKGYYNLINAFYSIVDAKNYLQNELMPSVVISTTASNELLKLTAINLSPVAVSSDSISSATANNAVLTMAKALINSNYRVEIDSYTYSSGVWQGKFKITNYSDDSDTAANLYDLRVTVNNDYETYLKQKIQKMMAKQDSIVYDMVGIFELTGDVFTSELDKYSLDNLGYILNMCQSVLDILIEQGVSDNETWSGQDPNLYNDLYLPYYNKLQQIENEITTKKSQMTTIQNALDEIQLMIVKVQSTLNLQNYLGDSLWNEFSAYRREDVFSNSNYISDGLNNAEIIQKATEFIEVAENEIYKSAVLQHSISTTLHNLLVMRKFELLFDSFQTGNWLRVQINDVVYKLRLLDYDIDYDNIDNIGVTFSDVLITAEGLSDQQSVIDKITTMASSYNYTQHQANQGSKSKVQIENWRENGLALTNLKIMNNAENQDVLIDNHGILCRQFEPITEKFLDTQLKIVNSTMAITDNNWRTTKTAVGRFFYQDPVSGIYKSAYGVNGEVIIGRLILGEQLGIYADDNKMTFDRNGLEITNNVNTFKVNPSSDNLFILSNEENDLIYVSSTGELHIKGNGDIQSLNYTVNTSGMRIDLSSGTIDTKNFKVDENGSAIMQNVTITSGIIKSANYIADSKGMQINLSDGSINSKNFKVDSEGSVTIDSGILSSANYVVNTSGGRINLKTGVIDFKNFKVSESGDVILSNAIFTGGSIQSSNFKIDTDNNVVAGTKINLSNGAIESKNFNVSSTGIVTLKSATFTGGILKTSNYVYNESGMQINLSTGTIYTVNFKLNSSGNIIANNIELGSNGGGVLRCIDDNHTGIKIQNLKLLFYYTNKELGSITPIHWSTSTTLNPDYLYETSYSATSSTDNTLSILANTNFEGITMGVTNGSTITPYYQLCYGDKYTAIGARHWFRGNIRLYDCTFQSCINFKNNFGISWGGNIGLRYWNSDNSKTGLWVGINAGGTNSCPTVITGTELDVKCSSIFNASITANYGLTAKSNITIGDNYGIVYGGNTAFRYNRNGVYGLGVYVGINTGDACDTYLWGSSVKMRAPVYFYNGATFENGEVNFQQKVTINDNVILRIGNETGIYCGNNRAFAYTNSYGGSVVVGIDSCNLRLFGSGIYLGSGSTAVSSDERKKKEIKTMPENYLNFIKSIRPVIFKYKEGLSDRFHTGFIAQEVLHSMKENNLTTKDFAGFVDMQQNNEEYALRYEEFISLLLKYAQHLEERICQIEERISG